MPSPSISAQSQRAGISSSTANNNNNGAAGQKTRTAGGLSSSNTHLAAMGGLLGGNTNNTSSSNGAGNASSNANSLDNSIVPYRKVPDKVIIKSLYTFGKVLGKGGFGTVKLATEKSTNITWAVKSIKKTIGSASRLEQLQREIDIMKVVRHRYIVQVKEIFETPKKVYILMENCEGGELVTKVRNMKNGPAGPITESDVRIILQRLLEVIAYLHGIGIVHRDLKPENILLSNEDPNDQFNLRVTDFGLAGYVGSNTVGTTDMMDNMVGTSYYIAPEVFSNVGYSKQCDIWSIGIILYLIFIHFDYEHVKGLLHTLRETGKLPYTEREFATVSPGAKQLMESMLQYDPAKRVTAKEILDHPWLKTGDSSSAGGAHTVLDMMKSYNAERRFRRAILVVLGSIRFFRPVALSRSATSGRGVPEPFTYFPSTISSSSSLVFNHSSHNALESASSTIVSSNSRMNHRPSYDSNSAAAAAANTVATGVSNMNLANSQSGLLGGSGGGGGPLSSTRLLSIPKNAGISKSSEEGLSGGSTKAHSHPTSNGTSSSTSNSNTTSNGTNSGHPKKHSPGARQASRLNTLDSGPSIASVNAGSTMIGNSMGNVSTSSNSARSSLTSPGTTSKSHSSSSKAHK